MDVLLGKVIRHILKDRKDLIKEDYRDGNHPMWGHCYVASEIYFHLKGGYDAGYEVHRVNTNEDNVHWFLVKEGELIDITADQFDEPIPYHNSTRCGFLTKQPSKRAKEVIDEVKDMYEKVDSGEMKEGELWNSDYGFKDFPESFDGVRLEEFCND